MFGMTPHFTIRVWGSPGATFDQLSKLLGEPRKRQLVAEIEVDTSDEAAWDLTVGSHRGLDIIPQKAIEGPKAV